MAALEQVKLAHISKPLRWRTRDHRAQWIRRQLERLTYLQPSVPLLARIALNPLDRQQQSELIFKAIDLAKSRCILVLGELLNEERLTRSLVARVRSGCPCSVAIVGGPIAVVDENESTREVPLLRELRALDRLSRRRILVGIPKRRTTTHFVFCDGKQACFYIEHHITPTMLERPGFLYRGDQVYDRQQLHDRKVARQVTGALWDYIKGHPDKFCLFYSGLPDDRNFLRLTHSEIELLEEELLQRGLLISSLTVEEIFDFAEGLQDDKLRGTLLTQRDEYLPPKRGETGG